jgi:hypothetical protein
MISSRALSPARARSLSLALGFESAKACVKFHTVFFLALGTCFVQVPNTHTQSIGDMSKSEENKRPCDMFHCILEKYSLQLIV